MYSLSLPNYNDWLRQSIKITDLFPAPENIRLDMKVHNGLV